MKYALKKVRRIIANDISTSKHLFTLSDLKTVQLTDGQDTVYADGSDGAHLAAFDTTKTSTITATNGAIDEGYIAAQVGSDVEVITSGKSVKIRETLVTADGTSVTLTNKASGTAGAEIKWIYPVDANGTPDSAKAYAQAGTASATEFSFAAATKIITLPTGKFTTGDTVVIDYYPTFTEYEEIQNKADSFSVTAEIIVDGWFTDICTQADVPLQLVMSRGKISGALDLSFGDQAAVQNVSIEGMTPNCDGVKKTLWVLRKYDLTKIDNT